MYGELRPGITVNKIVYDVRLVAWNRRACRLESGDRFLTPRAGDPCN